MVYSVSELEIPKIQELIITVFGNPVENDPFVSYLKYVDSENEIQGILSYSIIYERMEINYIYVEKNVRRKGIAQSLIDFLIKIACEKNIQNISLEVSKDNEAAILLYQKMGFQDKAIRPNYYQGIDGILMVKEMIK